MSNNQITNLDAKTFDLLEGMALGECLDEPTKEAFREVFRRARGYVAPTDSIVVFKDGSWKEVPRGAAWEYENDADYLVTIPAPGKKSEAA